MPKIVRILLNELEYGQEEEVLKPLIKSLLEGVLKVLAIDLNEATESNGRCKTLTILAVIFDEVTGYQDTGKFDLIENFASAGGLRYLEDYLKRRIATPSFLQPDAMYAILNMTAAAVEGNGEIRLARVNGLPEAFMSHLLHLEDEHLLRLGDDSIDICKRLNAIILHRSAYPEMSEYFSLQRKFVFRLISSTALPLKLLGYTQLQKLTEISTKSFPPPRAYLVQGAGIDDINGKYEFDFDYEGLVDGFIPCDALIAYIRKMPTSQGETSDAKEEEEKMPRLWKDSSCSFLWHIAYKDEMYSSFSQDELAPSSECPWLSLKEDSSRVPITLTAIKSSLVVPEGKEFWTLEHDFWDWIQDKRVLDVIADDTCSIISDVQQESIKAGRLLLCFIELMLSRVIQIIPEQSEFELKHSLLLTITTKFQHVMIYLLDLDYDSFGNIIPAFMLKISNQLKQISERIGESDPRHRFDYILFRRLLLVRLMITSRSSINEILRSDMTNPLPGAYNVTGAGYLNINGRYPLNRKSKDSRFFTYTKFPSPYDDDEDLTITIQQCLIGPERGKWFIVNHIKSDTNSEGDINYYASTSTNATPPEIGWTVCGGGISSVPTLTALQVDSTESDQQEVLYDLPDISRLDTTDQQSELWAAIRELSDFVGISVFDRTKDKKERIKNSLTSLHKLELNAIHKFFVSVAECLLLDSSSS